jgi:DNA modification methylase/predicted RNA-binding Zn-ribbon protein involved in translation (DUF1610 family)
MSKRKNGGDLFIEDSGQLRLDGKSAEQRAAEENRVECLGLSFENDEARRAHFLERLREKLRDPEFRKTEGFPAGDDEDILRLSDPPYYTACPNPFAEEFVRHYGKPFTGADGYHCEPFAVDVSEGKTDAIYSAHSYHTKVPHKAIMRAILHYTSPGDLVLDGFAGSGMTGVAAQMCGHPDAGFRKTVETEWEEAGYGRPGWGARRVVLNDLGPAASFITANYNLPFDVKEFERAARRILKELEQEIGWMYETLHTDGRTKGIINYTVWSDVFACPECAGEVVFVEAALDEETKHLKDAFPCPSCGAELTKTQMERLYETYVDTALGRSTRRLMRKPVFINYSVGKKKKFEKKPDENDLETLKRIELLPIPHAVPTNEIPFMHMTHQRARMEAFGITHIHHFYLPRGAGALGVLWSKVFTITDTRIRNMLLFFVEQAVWGMSVLARYVPTHYSQVNQYMTGVFYVSSKIAECSPWYILAGKLERLLSTFSRTYAEDAYALVGTGTAAKLPVPDFSVDYIFTDPPFGENIYYADLNFLVESWHRLWTDAMPEAIVDRAKNKGLPDYQQLMQRCFEEYCRVLKPGRWMTVVFHNSRNSVWNAIQEAMLAAGFVVADVRTLDKQQGSYRQVTSTAVKQDLVISAYRPSSNLEERFKLEAGTQQGVWEFVRSHLQQLPVFVSKDGRAETVAERMSYLLFDRMVAFHVQRGVSVPVSAAEFYIALVQRFPLRDEMYFLHEQVAEYDKKRITVKEILQLEFFVNDEASARNWLTQQLKKKRQTFQQLHPKFMREIGGWKKYEKPLELLEILESNFLSDDADRWYVADPSKAEDLLKLRERALLKEFDEYRGAKQKKLKVFRLEAVRTGFQRAWQQRDYQTIIEVARKIPEDVLQEDPKLLMFFDQAITRTGAE